MSTSPVPVSTGTTRGPSARDLELLSAIVEYKRSHDGCAPPTRALMAACHMGSTSVVNLHVLHLERDGLIQRGPGKCQIQVKGGQWLPPEHPTADSTPA